MTITTLQDEQNNIFSFANSENLSCQIWIYHHSHRELIIQVSEVNKDIQLIPSFYVYFANVRSFDGVTSWNGADFCVASLSKLIGFIDTRFRKFGGFTDIHGHDLSTIFNLYTVNTRDGDEIVFLAAQSPLISTIEPRLTYK